MLKTYLQLVYDYDVIVMGGGLAGLTAAIHLSQQEFRVLVVEKQVYPRHKVCGEYVSNEVKPYLEKLDIDIDQHTSVAIDTLHLSTQNGKSITVKLPLGGFGLSRYAFDELLYQKAMAMGTSFHFDIVENVVFNGGIFELMTKKGTKYKARLVIGAFGKRSTLDVALQRKFIRQKSPWLGIKMHYKYSPHPDNLVGLHNFEGGYAGISKIENGNVNFCYLVSYESFQRVKTVNDFTQEIMSRNPILDKFLSDAEPLFEKPMTIAQVSFQRKHPIERNIPMVGDSAGLIHPLCGNGMAMAIHSAKMISECALSFLKNSSTLQQMNHSYATQWNAQFHRRLWLGRKIQTVLLSPWLSNAAIGSVARSERLLKGLISQTHGIPIAS